MYNGDETGRPTTRWKLIFDVSLTFFLSAHPVQPVQTVVRFLVGRIGAGNRGTGSRSPSADGDPGPSPDRLVVVIRVPFIVTAAVVSRVIVACDLNSDAAAAPAAVHAAAGATVIVVVVLFLASSRATRRAPARRHQHHVQQVGSFLRQPETTRE